MQPWQAMPKMIQIRNVPDDLHARLTARAAAARLSLSDYLVTELQHLAAQPTWPELAGDVAAWPPAQTSTEGIVGAIRATRDARDTDLARRTRGEDAG
jgi:antitoxin FitA